MDLINISESKINVPQKYVIAGYIWSSENLYFTLSSLLLVATFLKYYIHQVLQVPTDLQVASTARADPVSTDLATSYSYRIAGHFEVENFRGSVGKEHFVEKTFAEC